MRVFDIPTDPVEAQSFATESTKQAVVADICIFRRSILRFEPRNQSIQIRRKYFRLHIAKWRKIGKLIWRKHDRYSAAKLSCMDCSETGGSVLMIGKNALRS